jgi:hypothetical protein
MTATTKEQMTLAIRARVQMLIARATAENARLLARTS